LKQERELARELGHREGRAQGIAIGMDIARKERRADDWSVGYNTGFAEGKRAERESLGRTVRDKLHAGNGAGLDAGFLRSLIVLCHPDKHGNSRAANEVTQRLLKMREESARGH
jgi:hypothetical protein